MDQIRFGWSREEDVSSTFGENSAALWPEDTVESVDWVIHEGWDAQALSLGLSVNHDIALVFSDTAVDVPYSYLPLEEEVEQIDIGTEVDIVGWGRRTSAQSSESGSRQQAQSYVSKMADPEIEQGCTTGSRVWCEESGIPAIPSVPAPLPESKGAVCSAVPPFAIAGWIVGLALATLRRRRR